MLRLTDVAKALRLRVPIVILEVFVFLGSVVPCQLQQPLPVGRAREVVAGRGVGGGVAKEKQGEGIGFVGAQERHSENLLIVLQARVGVLDPDHGVVLLDSLRQHGFRGILRV